ncbi:hypothetical protein D3C76_208660 [compost metagenome]
MQRNERYLYLTFAQLACFWRNERYLYLTFTQLACFWRNERYLYLTFAPAACLPHAVKESGVLQETCVLTKQALELGRLIENAVIRAPAEAAEWNNGRNAVEYQKAAAPQNTLRGLPFYICAITPPDPSALQPGWYTRRAAGAVSRHSVPSRRSGCAESTAGGSDEAGGRGL